jgi:hypothetical protein
MFVVMVLKSVQPDKGGDRLRQVILQQHNLNCGKKTICTAHSHVSDRPKHVNRSPNARLDPMESAGTAIRGLLQKLRPRGWLFTIFMLQTPAS